MLVLSGQLVIAAALLVTACLLVTLSKPMSFEDFPQKPQVQTAALVRFGFPASFAAARVLALLTGTSWSLPGEGIGLNTLTAPTSTTLPPGASAMGLWPLGQATLT